MRILSLAILAWSISAAAQAPGIPSREALDHFLSMGPADGFVLDLNAVKNLEKLQDGMAVYRILVKAEGTLDQWERISGYPELQAQAEQSIAQWRFAPIRFKEKEGPAAWWSVVGVCYGAGWGALVPCEPPASEPSQFKETALPVRLVLRTTTPAGSTDRFEVGPIKKLKGFRLFRSEGDRIARIQGRIIIVFSITPDGKAEHFQAITGHPLLVTDAVEILKRWKFAPIAMLGTQLPATVILTIDFDGND